MKKIISVLLAAVMAVVCAVPAAAAGGSDTVYVALGDSIAYGYGLPHYEEERYPQLVADTFGFELYDYAVNGMTSGGLLTLVQGSKLSPDAPMYCNMGDAKLITVSIGSNDLLGVLSTIFMTAAAAVENILSEGFGSILEMSVTSDTALGMFDNGVEEFRSNLPQIYAALREINPGCAIVFTRFYNPYVGVKFGSFDFGALCDKYICQMNDILDAKGDMNYYIADAYTPMNEPGMSNVDVFSGNVDPHPNVAGHEAIADAVKLAADAALAAMPEETEPAIPETVLPETESEPELPEDTEAAENAAEEVPETEDGSALVGTKEIPWGKVGLIGLAVAVFAVTACVVSIRNKKRK